MRYFLSLCCLVLGLVALPAFAQPVTINGVPIEAIGAGKATIMPNGDVIQSIGFKATPPGATQPSYYQRAVQYTKGTVGGNVKQFAKFSAYSLVFTGILHGIGWGLDQITGDIYSSPPQDSIYSAPSGMIWTAGGPNFGPTAYDAARLRTDNGFVCPQCSVHLKQAYSNTHHRWVAKWTDGSPVGEFDVVLACQVSGCSVPSSFPTEIPTNTDQLKNSPAQYPTPEEIAQEVAPLLSQDLLDKLSTHPQTGAVKQTQEVLDKMTEIANQVAKEADPTKAPVSAPTASPTANTTDVPASAGIGFPSFCIWAKAVCDWFDWTREPPTDLDDPEMPETDFNGVLPYNSGLGYGQCPADKGVNLSWAPAQSFSYEPFCQLAIGIKPLVIASAGIFALFILSGYGRGRKGG